MVVVNKVTQITETKIEKLILLAREKGHKDDHTIAKWIISTSPYWRSQGYKNILEAMKDSHD